MDQLKNQDQEQQNDRKKNLIETLSQNIVEKKELSSIDIEFVKNQLSIYFNKNPKIYQALLELSVDKISRSKHYKQALKDSRSELRKTYGIFILDKLDFSLLDNINMNDKEIHKQILSNHASTKERIDLYEAGIYSEIFAITDRPKSIIDLGCGLNPISIIYMRLDPKKTYYFASDIGAELCEYHKKYFDAVKINGDTKVIDLKEIEKNSQLIMDITKREFDVCFLFKVLDSIETKGHKLAENLIKHIPAKYVVASFATNVVKGTKMNHPYRGWIERMFERLNYEFRMIEKENEIFYVIKLHD